MKLPRFSFRRLGFVFVSLSIVLGSIPLAVGDFIRPPQILNSQSARVTGARDFVGNRRDYLYSLDGEGEGCFLRQVHDALTNKPRTGDLNCRVRNWTSIMSHQENLAVTVYLVFRRLGFSESDANLLDAVDTALVHDVAEWKMKDFIPEEVPNWYKSTLESYTHFWLKVRTAHSWPYLKNQKESSRRLKRIMRLLRRYSNKSETGDVAIQIVGHHDKFDYMKEVYDRLSKGNDGDLFELRNDFEEMYERKRYKLKSLHRLAERMRTHIEGDRASSLFEGYPSVRAWFYEVYIPEVADELAPHIRP